MSVDDREAEDVSSLFRKFGGDASGYKEFEPLEDNATGAGWALVPGKGPAAAPAVEPPAASAAAVPMPPAAPAVQSGPTAFAPRPQTAAPFFAAPAARPGAAVPAATVHTAAAPAGAPRELDLLFARLAGQASEADPGHRLLSRWRRPS